MSSNLLPCLSLLRRQHHSLQTAYLLHLPSASELALPASQAFLVEHILHDPLVRDVQPDRGYRRSFWRRIVQELEEGIAELQAGDPGHADEYEVDERIYQALAGLMVSSPSPTPSELPKQSYRTFLYDRPSWASQKGEGRVTLSEEQIAIQAGTTGLRTWTASLHLGHHILANPGILSHSYPHGTPPLPPHRPLIELGSGTGFISILLTQLGYDVITTDLGGDEARDAWIRPLERLKENVTLNDLQHPPRVEALDWTDGLRRVEDRPTIWRNIIAGPPRTILAADVIYDPDLVIALVATLRVLLSSTGSTGSIAIIAATIRNPATLHYFFSTCSTQSLLVTILGLIPMNPDSPTFWDSALDRDCEVRIMRICLDDNG